MLDKSLHICQRFCALLLLVGISTAWGQSSCQEIITESGRLKGLIADEKKKNIDFKSSFRAKIAEMNKKNLRLPPQYKRPIKIPDASRANYQDERGLCKVKGVSWGTVKDLREYKLDSLRLENAILEVRILNLKQTLNSQGKTSPQVEEKFTLLGKSYKTHSLTAQRAAYAGHSYSYCIINPKTADLNIANKPITSTNHGFQALDNYFRKRSKTLTFAMNAGMYKPNRQPVGLLISNGKSKSVLNRKSGRGNFYMKPNGVFGIMDDGTAFIHTTNSYVNRGLSAATVWLATQSGPIMILNGKINPEFTYQSENIHFRNAVGIQANGKVVFAISEQRVNFHEFSSFLKELNCVNALYLDGTVSRMYLPALNKYQDLEDSRHLGPILYIVE